jgi:type IV pilus assembly protein PilM
MALNFKRLFSSIKSDALAGPKFVVGIDFGASSVKVVELEQRETLLALKTYGELQLAPYANQPLGSAVQLPLEKRIEALVDVMREAKVTGASGVLALPLASSFVTVIDMVATADEDLGPRVQVEARKFVPVPLTEVSLDWTELPPLNKSSTAREVLVAAVHNDSYREMNALLEAVKLASQPTEVEIFSVLRAVTKAQVTSIAIVDFGAQTTKLYIAENGMVRKIHRVFAGGAQATQRLAEMHSIPFEEAENLKRNYQAVAPEAADIHKVMTATFERALQEFKRVIASHETRTGAPLQSVLITGGGASFPDMQKLASYYLDRSVEVVNPFNKIAYPAFLEDTLIDIAPTFSVALGAALRPFSE